MGVRRIPFVISLLIGVIAAAAIGLLLGAATQSVIVGTVTGAIVAAFVVVSMLLDRRRNPPGVGSGEGGSDEDGSTHRPQPDVSLGTAGGTPQALVARPGISSAGADVMS